MATRKTAQEQSNVEQVQTQEQNASTKNIPQEEIDKLPPKEQQAIAEVQAAPTSTGQAYKLRDPNTQYVDIDTKWTIARDQIKALPEGYNMETIQRIKEGFLIPTDEAVTHPNTPAEPVVAASSRQAEDNSEGSEN